MSQNAGHSALDRLLHRMAFAMVEVQKGWAEAERWPRGAPDPLQLGPPLFIAGLPRAGTTLLLEAFVATGGFATHTYRQMPFLLTPLTWAKFSRRFRLAETKAERAHGDGMEVGFDSPEAFEEALWRAFFPGRYRGSTLQPWPHDLEDAHGEFRAFFHQHMRNIVRLAQPADRNPAPDYPEPVPPAPPGRYISKNNGNIARLPMIARQNPTAQFIVPFREPLAQAHSLWRQHLRFSDIHRKDPFSARYMRDIGHYEFGANLKPIDFDGWLGGHAVNAERLDFWIAYWTAAYGHLLREAPERTAFVAYDRLCADPAAGLGALFTWAGVDADAAALAAGWRAAPTAPDDPHDERLLEAAQAVHRELLSRALV